MIISCIGDCGIDNYLDENLLRPGGITLNFAVHARKLFPDSDTVEVLTVLGHGDDSTIVSQTIKKHKLASVVEYRKGRAPVQYIRRKPSGEKVFAGYDEEVLKDFVLSSEQKAHAEQSDFLITPLYAQIEPLFHSVMSIKSNGIKSVDFMDLSDYDKQTAIVKTHTAHFDIGFFGLNMADQSLLTDLEALSKVKKKLFVITLGKDGSMAFENGRKYHQPAEAVEYVVDTTGAGDAFAAAFTKHYLYTKNIQESLKQGNMYASRIIQQLGTF